MQVGRTGSIVLGIVVMTALAACGDSQVEGDGEVVTESRQVEQFSAVRVSNGADVFLTIDTAATGEVDLAVTTDANLQESVTTEVSGETLRVSIDAGGEAIPTQGFEITGTVGALSDVEANDGGEATITAAVSTITLKAADGGRINGDALEAEIVEVEADSGARITVCATGTVTGSVTNGADVVVMCGGNVTAVETSNGGTVTTP